VQNPERGGRGLNRGKTEESREGRGKIEEERGKSRKGRAKRRKYRAKSEERARHAAEASPRKIEQISSRESGNCIFYLVSSIVSASYIYLMRVSCMICS